MSLKKLFCNHKNREMIKWNYTHGCNGMEPMFIEVEYKCHDCGKVFYQSVHNNIKEFQEKYTNKYCQ